MRPMAISNKIQEPSALFKYLRNQVIHDLGYFTKYPTLTDYHHIAENNLIRFNLNNHIHVMRRTKDSQYLLGFKDANPFPLEAFTKEQTIKRILAELAQRPEEAIKFLITNKENTLLVNDFAANQLTADDHEAFLNFFTFIKSVQTAANKHSTLPSKDNLITLAMRQGTYVGLSMLGLYFEIYCAVRMLTLLTAIPHIGASFLAIGSILAALNIIGAIGFFAIAVHFNVKLTDTADKIDKLKNNEKTVMLRKDTFTSTSLPNNHILIGFQELLRQIKPSDLISMARQGEWSTTLFDAVDTTNKTAPPPDQLQQKPKLLRSGFWDKVTLAGQQTREALAPFWLS